MNHGYVLVALAALTLAACADSEPEAPAAPSAAVEPAAEAPRPAPIEAAEPEAAAAAAQTPASQGLPEHRMPEHSEEFVEKAEQFRNTLLEQAQVAYQAALAACGELSGQEKSDCERAALLRYNSAQESAEVRYMGLMSRRPRR
ncbi:MAG TPA: hypothetical protein VFG21_07630 [Xanthomonadaceae bacterium]|nr:hypothetical protein [Xanthomonadaceae bacterium]